MDDYINDSTLRSKTPLRRKLYRGFIIICTLVVIVNGFIFLGQGTINVQNIADDVRDGTDVSEILKYEVVFLFLIENGN